MSDLTKRIAALPPEKRKLLLQNLQKGKEDVPQAQILPRKGDTNVFPLSFAQQRLWFLDQLEPSGTAYLIPTAQRMLGNLSIEALKQSLEVLIHRHESLRTTFQMRDGHLVQVIHPAKRLVIPVVDLQELLPEHREGQARRLARQEQEQPCDLEKGPLLRTAVLRLESQEHVLLLTLHHIITDAWSNQVQMRELSALYRAFVTGQSSPLAPLPIQYADYALWQRQWLQDEMLQEQLGYWRKQLADLSPLALPTDRPHPAVHSSRGASQSRLLPAPLSLGLMRLCQQEHVTLFMTLLAAFEVLLARYNGQTDIAVGTPIANRRQEEIEGLIGFFVNTLVLRCDLSDNPTFVQLLGRVREMCLGAYAHQDIPFEKVVEELQPERDLSRSPLFQVMFVLQNTPMEQESLAGIRVSPLAVESSTSKFDLALLVVETEHGLSCALQYRTDLFEAQTIRRMLGHWQILLEAIVHNPQAHISDLSWLTEGERHQLLFEWNETQVDYPQDVCVHQLFEQQAQRTPDAVALVFEDEAITYADLNRRANQVGHYLQSLGVGPEVLVGLSLERCLEVVLVLLAVLKAGGAYVPLDPSYPMERLAFMMADAAVLVLLTQQRLQGYLPALATQVIVLEQVWERLLCQPDHTPISTLCVENLAYVIYTSGSTGRPKGVQVTHRGVSNLALARIQTLAISPRSRVLQRASLSFDVSISEMLTALLAGASLHLERTERLFPGPDLLQVLQKQAISVAMLPPSVLAVLSPEDLSTLQTVVTGGEPCPAEVMAQWATGRHFFHEYGPTEATVCATVAQCLAEPANQRSLSLGRPLANTQFYLLDRYLQPVPVGVPGEISLAGIGLGRGYVHLPELTAERFVPHPCSREPGTRLYRTGDLARYHCDGTVEYLGRCDQQVKLRGYRIELGEIEAVLRQHPAIQECVVLVREDVLADKRLVAYAVVHQGERLTVSDVRSYLQDRLPSYTIPSACVFLDALPLTLSGKVDRRALPAPEGSNRLSSAIDSDGELRPSVQPRDAVEWQLVQIWEEVLQIQPVSVLDTFFDLGGHSLLAVSLMSRIELHFGRHLGLATLFEHPTVAELAVVLRQQIPSEGGSPLVAIQPHGSRPAFFCVHPVEGTAFCYVNLARCLGSDQPFYGLHASNQSRVEGTPKTIEELGAAYVAAIQAVQPQGPYLLGGWSLGGVVAFEMAQQLQRQGHEVSLLAVIDSKFPGSQERTQAAEKEVDLGDRRIARLLMDHCHIPVPDDFDHREPDEQFSYAAEQVKKRHFFPVDTSLQFVHHYGRTILLHLHMMRLYVPQRYQHQIDYFVASASMEHTAPLHEREDATAVTQDHLQCWREVAEGGVEVHLVPGDHWSIVEEPSVQVLAEALKQCIDRVCNELPESQSSCMKS